MSPLTPSALKKSCERVEDWDIGLALSFFTTEYTEDTQRAQGEHGGNCRG